MIKLTGGNVQNLSNVAVPNGTLTLQLNGDAAIIASPGFVSSAFQQVFKFDATGNLAGQCNIWSNAELNPQTQYLVTFKDATGSKISNQIWQFIQSSGATVDIGTIIPVAPSSSAAAVPFSSVAANFVFAGPASGSAAFPAFRALVANDLPAVVFFTQVTTATLSVSGNATVGGTIGVTGTSTLAAALATSLTTGQIIQPAATALTIKSNQGGTYYSLPADGISQATINNSKLTGASSANNVTLLNEQNNLAPVVGTGADAQVFTWAIPANVVAVGKSVSIEYWFSHSTGSATVTYKIKSGSASGTTLDSFGTASAGTLHIKIILYNQGSGLFSLAAGPLTGGGAIISGGPGYNSGNTGDFSVGFSVTLTFSVAGTDQVTPQHHIAILNQ